MYKVDDILYAEAGSFLKHRSRNMVGLALRGEESEFVEVPFARPLNARLEHGRLSWGGMFCLRIGPARTYEEVKTAIIKTRYSNDDQIAVMLNRERSEAHAEAYRRMQQWRSFAAMLAGDVAPRR